MLRLSTALGRNDKMTFSSAKIVGILALSVILTNSGVAWALSRCLTDSASRDHIHLPRTEMGSVVSSRAHSSPTVVVEHRHQPPSRIHCTETQILKLDFGPASSVFRLDSSKNVNLIRAFLAAPLTDTAGTSNASLPESVYLAKLHQSPHLLISKLRI